MAASTCAARAGGRRRSRGTRRRGGQQGCGEPAGGQPGPAAASPITRYSARWTVATMAGPAPTALSSPTRRRWPMTRPATMPATLATARAASSQLPISMTFRAFCTSLPSWSAMNCQVVLIADPDAREAAGSASFRFSVYDSDCLAPRERRDVAAVDPDQAAGFGRGCPANAPAGRRVGGPGGGDRGPGHAQRMAVMLTVSPVRTRARRRRRVRRPRRRGAPRCRRSPPAGRALPEPGRGPRDRVHGLAAGAQHQVGDRVRSTVSGDAGRGGQRRERGQGLRAGDLGAPPPCPVRRWRPGSAGTAGWRFCSG